VPLLWGQVADVLEVDAAPDVGTRFWARREECARVEASPVLLALATPPAAVGHLRDHPDEAALRCAQELPPPGLGEYGVIVAEDRQSVYVYPLIALGPDGEALQREMHDAVLALAAPADWWLLSEPLLFCMHGGDHRQRLVDLSAAHMRSADAQERRSLHAQLAEVKRAVQQARALEEVRARGGRTAQLAALRLHAAALAHAIGTTTARSRAPR